MVSISQLSTVPSVSSGDYFPCASASMGVDAKATGAQLLAFIQANYTSPDFTVQTAAPTTTGFTAALAAAAGSIWAIINPTGNFATGAITLPPVADAFDGQQILVSVGALVEALTVNGNGATVVGAPSSVDRIGGFILRYRASTATWHCLSESVDLTNASIVLTKSIDDANRKALLSLNSVASAVNALGLTNAATGGSPLLKPEGSDVDIGLTLQSKGDGLLALIATDSIQLFTTSGPIDIGSVTGQAVIGCLLQLGAQTVQQTPGTVAALPAANSVAGGRRVVSNATATLTAGIGAIVAGGGANIVPVFSDGTNWRIG